MVPGLAPDYQRIPQEISLMVSEKRHFRRRWQATRDLVDKAAFNRLTDKLGCDLRVFRRNNWELTTTQIGDVEVESFHTEYLPQ